MSVVSPSAFRRRLRALDAGELADFVAALWAARGRETAVDGAVVTVVEPGGEPRQFVCIPDRRFGRPDASSVPDGADAVVAAGAMDALGDSLRDRDVRLVGPEELRELLLYGLDRGTAEQLAATHLGRSIAARRTDDGRSVSLDVLPSEPTIAAGVLVVVVVLASLAVVMGGGFPSDGDAATSVTPVGTEPSAADFPPGVGPDGVTDLDALLAAHVQSVANRTYGLSVVHHDAVDPLNPERRWALSRQTVERVRPTRFHYRVTGLHRTPTGDRTLVIYDDYADDNATYRRLGGDASPTFRRGLLPSAGEQGAFTAVAEVYLRRFLATSQSRVEVVAGPNGTRYRLVATGTPRHLDGPVSNYTAVALIDRDGFVHRLTVDYVRGARAGDEEAFPAGPVRFELSYRALDETRAPPPAWYDEARRKANETVELRSPDSLWWTPPIGIDYREED